MLIFAKNQNYYLNIINEEKHYASYESEWINL